MENSSSFFYLSDVKRLFLKKKCHLLCIFVVFFLITAIVILSIELKYEAKASFFDDKEKTQTIGNVKDIVLSESFSQMTDAGFFLKTKTLNKKLVENLGLQISVIDDTNKFMNLYKTILKNIKWYFYKEIEEEDFLEFSEVCYEKSDYNNYYLKIFDRRTFEIYDSNHRYIDKKNIYEHIKIKNLCFTINKIPKKFLNKTIKIKVEPWDVTVNNLLKDINIKKEKNSQNFLLLTIKYPSRKYSTKILNNLMNLYHEYLITENDNLIKNQIDCLEKRKNNLEQQFFSLLKENEKEINSNVKTKGFLDLSLEINYLLKQRENNQKLLEKTNNDLEYLKKVDLNVNDKNICVDENILNILDEIKRFEEQKKALQISIDKDISSKKDINLDDQALLKMDRLIIEKNQIDDLIEKINANEPIIEKKTIIDLNDKNLSLSFLQEKRNVVKNKIKLLKFDYSDFNKKKLSILDLKNAKDLFFQLDKFKEDLKSEISQIKHILLKIDTSNFQISSISNFLSYDLIKNMIEISKKIKDEQNYTNKEIEILKQEYDIEKRCIIVHLKDLLSLKNLNLTILNQRLFSLKKIQVNLLANEIKFLATKVENLISKTIYEKTNEKRILKDKLNDIKNNLQNLISKISLENKFKMQSDLIKNTIESISKLIESKKIDLKLKIINSKPIDLATVSISPINLYLNSFIVAFLSVIIFFILCLYITLLKGFSLSPQVIKDLSFEYCGEISFQCDGIEVNKLKSKDLESLRKIISCLNELKNKIVTTICSKGPNYIHYLAALLTIIGKKILVIETKSKNDDKNGLFPFLEKNVKKLPTQKIQAYDFVPSGEKKYFAFELLKSSKFLEKLQQIKSKYDLILIYSDAKIDSAESRIYLEFSDKVILTFKKETLEDIKIFVNWAKDKTKLCFLTY